MHKLHIQESTSFAELDLEYFQQLKFALYVLDHDWNYLFINDMVKKNVGSRADDLVGKNMWECFPELAGDPTYLKMKADTEKGLAVNFTTTSPVTGFRLNVVGYALKDCYLFYASLLPKKEDLLNELRLQLEKEK